MVSDSCFFLYSLCSYVSVAQIRTLCPSEASVPCRGLFPESSFQSSGVCMISLPLVKPNSHIPSNAKVTRKRLVQAKVPAQ